MVQLYQFPIGQRAKGSLWLSGSEPTPSKWGLPLAVITLPDVGGCIRPQSWLVVALGMSPMRQSSATLMVSAYSFMEFLQCVLPLLGGEAFEIRVV